MREAGHAEIPQGAKDFDAYCAEGGYQTLKAIFDGTHSREEILGIMDKAALRGLGGAGFPTGRKWRIVGIRPARG